MIESGLTGQSVAAAPPEEEPRASLEVRILNTAMIVFLVVLGLGLGAFAGLFISLYLGWIRIYC